MMPAARIGDLCTGHGCFAARPAVMGSANVLINGKGAHRVGDDLAVHCCGPKCHGGKLAKGSATVFVNGKPLGRVGDAVDCGSTMAMGSPNVFCGG